MAAPGGAYGNVQWNNGGGNFGGEATFYYNGKLHVGMTNDVGDQYKIQSGNSIYAAKDLYIGQDLIVRRQIQSLNIVSGQIFPVWEQISGAWTMVNKTGSDFRTAISVYGKSDTYSRSESDNRYLAASAISNYYTKAETYGIADLYNKTQVYTKAEINAMLLQYCTIDEVNQLLAGKAQQSHSHSISVSYAGSHSHSGSVPTTDAHYHTASATTPV